MYWIIPIAVAIVAGGTIFALWHWLLKYVPVMQTPQNLFGILIGAFVTVAAVYTTATFFVSAVIGERAVRDHMMATLDQYEVALNTSYSNFKSEQSILTKLNESAAVARALVAAEAQRGGCGRKCRELEDVAEDFQRTRSLGLEYQQAGAEDFKEGQRALAEIRGRLTSDLSPSQAQRLFSGAKSNLVEVVESLNANSVIDLGYNVGNVSADVEGGYQIGELTQGLRETVDRVKFEREPEQIPTYLPLNQYQAITQDVGKYGLLWAFAVFLETFPLIILVTRTLMVWNYRNNQSPRAEDEESQRSTPEKIFPLSDTLEQKVSK